MPTPLLNLLVLALVALVAAVLFWPGGGLIARLTRKGRAAGRVIVEDALKHIFDSQFRGRMATLDSLSGVLQIARSKTVELIERMQRAGLVTPVRHHIELTDEGRRYALQVIRAHRLWERYLADETGVDPVKWHASAERREHKITPEEANELAMRLGNPSRDPHGDPIPTAEGTVPAEEIIALSALEAGEEARVVHMEDEPEIVYAQLIAQGIYVGMELRLEAKTDTRIIIEADGRELALASILAANVSIERLSQRETIDDLMQPKTLSSLGEGEAGRVVRINPACRGVERRRLMDLGIVPGTLVRFERRSLSGGSTAYAVRDTLIALRDEQADMIAIEPAAAAAPDDDRNHEVTT